MKSSNHNQTVLSVSPIDYCRGLCLSRWLMVVMAVQLAIFLLGAPSATAALVNPDLTTTDGRAEALADGDVINLGPTGLIGWLGHNNDDTSESRQILITAVDGSSPASGKLQADDVILGVSGDGTIPVDFASDARMALALAIGEAEANNPAELKVKRWRSGTTTTQTLTLQNLGAYSATAPWNCPKSTAILEAAVEYTYDNEDSGKYGENALALLAVRDLTLAGTSNTNRKNKAEDWTKDAILSSGDITKLMNNEVDDGSGGYLSWTYGHKLIVLSEYYLQTGDNSVYPSIEALARGIANGMSVWGTMGHRLTQPDKVDGSLNGVYQWGYGTVNSAGLPCFLGLTLAKECGVNDSRVDAGIAAAAQTFAGYANVGGTIPYGEHAAGINSSENNGKNSLAALAMSRVTGFEDQAKTFGYMAASAASQFGKGHTGSWFAKVWQPLGANLVGDAAGQTHFNDIKWRLDLARRHDGGFSFNDIYQGNNGTSDATWKNYGFWANTHAILTYAMPYGKLSITDNTHNSANHLTGGEVSAAAFASSYDATTRSNADLVTDLDHDIVPVGYAAAEEIGARNTGHAYFLTELHAKLPNVAEPENGRMMACYALGQIASNGGPDSNTSAALLAALLEDGSLRIRYGAAFGLRYFSDSAKLTVTTEILNAVVNTAKPIFPKDAEDPMQLAHGQLCYLTFYNGSASGPTGYLKNDKIYTHNIDPELYRPALQTAGKTAMGHARSGVGKIYPELTQEDFEFLCPVIIETIENQPPLDRMFGSGARAGGLAALQERGIADGVGLAKFVHWDLNMPGNETNRFTDAIDVLKDYAGSSELVVPDQGIEAYLQSIVDNSGAGNEVINAQAVLDAIAADSNPTPLTSLKSLSVTAADSSLASPAVWTTLHVTGDDLALAGDPVVTWSKKSGPGNVTFAVEDSSSGVFDLVVYTDGTPGTYTIEFKISDTRGYAETGNNASFANGYSEVTETIDITVTGGSTTPANTVPDVIGMTEGLAGSIIVAEGFTVGSISSEHSSTIPIGEVASQNPAGSTILTPGTAVHLVISLGGQIVPAPDVLGLSQATAESSIIAANFVVGNVTTALSESVPAGDVISQNPVGSTSVATGSSVDLVISLGPVDLTPPAIADLSPTNTAADVRVNTTLVMTFDEPVQKGSGNIVIQQTAGDTFETIDVNSASVSINGAEVTITPGSSLAGNTGYHVEIDHGAIEDVAGNDFAGISGSGSWSFITGSAVIYSFEDFDTPGLTTGTLAVETNAYMDYDNTTTATNNGVQIVANLGGGPTGQHMELRKASERHISTQDGLMTLATDNMMSIDVSFSVRFNNEATTNLILEYSASGIFDDTELIVTLDPLAGDVPNLDAGIWYNLTTTILATDVTFTDTAKLRWQTSKDRKTFLDDVQIVGTAPSTQFSDWIDTHFPGETDPDIIGLDADPDGDRLPNGLDAWFGTDPGAFNVGLVGLANGGLTTTYEHPQNETPPSDLSGFYEWSSDLDDWYACDGVNGPPGGPTVTVGTTTVAGTTTVTTTASESLERLFLRISVIQD